MIIRLKKKINNRTQFKIKSYNGDVMKRYIKILAFCLIVTALFIIITQRNDPVIKANIFKRSDVTVKKNETHHQIELNHSNQWLVRASFTDSHDYGEKNCRKLHNTKVSTSLLRKWKELVSKYNIRYFLDSGSLLGAWRNGDFIPYDQDIDVVVNENDFLSLKNISIRVTSRVFDPLQNDTGFHLYFTTDWEKPYHKRNRYNCKGHLTDTYEDRCSFTDPMARLFHKNQHIDLFAFEEGDGMTFKFKPPRDYLVFRKREIFPAVKCSLSGIECRCPKNVKRLLSKLYQRLEPYYACVGGKWRIRRRAGQAGGGMRVTLYSILVFLLVIAVVIFYWRKKKRLKN